LQTAARSARSRKRSSRSAKTKREYLRGRLRRHDLPMDFTEARFE
jgi:hypothetical protein